MFGLGLVLNRYAGSHITFHVGDRPSPSLLDGGAPTRAYLDALNDLPQLATQGHGVRSFMGLMIHIITSAYFTVVVDEPEAFLHPPQAYELGRTLVREKSADTQLILATHSADILRGLLDAGDSSVTIVRLSRDGSVNPAAVLDGDRVRKLWQDPMLKYSNILDGLFHEGVIVCEGEADCRFYSTAVSQLTTTGKLPQLLFTHCGGKARMPQVMDALKAVHVPTSAVLDFDVLREEHVLKRIVASAGGDWAAIQKDYTAVKSVLDRRGDRPQVVDVRRGLLRILDATTSVDLSENDARQIRSTLQIDSAWDQAKRDGKLGLPSGDVSRAAERLLSQLEEWGVFIVPIGELERFIPAIGGHGSGWLAKVFEQGMHSDPGSMANAHSFVKRVLAQHIDR